ncbi:hypothetical protein NUW58_g2365 [Xylaria curta]|uniref:Uncharacterized protein n=1 Tax=Xylaria curta TaxID=42375 RepID=A0ACC1PGG1_9PEZI|nr:hypothetical protein NUW58_g2365 [Xylaria curta]
MNEPSCTIKFAAFSSLQRRIALSTPVPTAFSVRLLGFIAGAGGSWKLPPDRIVEGRKVRDPANNPAKIAVAPHTRSELVGAWRFGARADDDHVRRSPLRTSPSLAADEHLVKEVRQPAKDAVQQPIFALIYLFPVVSLAVVLTLARASLGSPQPAARSWVVCMTYSAQLHLLLLIASPNQVTQLFLADIKVQYPHIFTLNPFQRTFSSPPAVIVEGAVCESPHPFATSPPISLAPTMANSLVEETKRIVAQFEYTDDDVNRGVQEFLRQMNEGLRKDGTSISQIPTYVTGVPNGTEKVLSHLIAWILYSILTRRQGLYMAVDLGGTNFRVCSVHLNGDTTFDLTYNKVAIPKELMVAKKSEELFGFLAKQIELFLKTHHEDHFEAHVRRRKSSKTADGYEDENIFQLGFTFSFPVQQFGINKGSLIRWTKGFDIHDAVGKDVCALLQEQIDLLHLPVKVAALVNDTVGTLMARSYAAPGKTSTLIGAIFGTGTNGAYVEKITNLQKSVDGEYDKSTGEMVINTEWGSFDNQLNVLPNTPYDAKLDKDSVNPGIQIFEKRVSGMFLGEIVRLAIVDLYENPKVSLFKDANSKTSEQKSTRIGDDSGLLKQWGLDSSLMSIAAADSTPELSNLRKELDSQLQIRSASVEEAQAFKDIAYAVGRRAARLSAVALGGIVIQSGRLEETNDQPVDIGADGSLVEHYPLFRDMIHEAFKSIKGIGAEGADRIRIGIARDGSGVGAALIALVAAGMEKKGIADELAAIKNAAAQKLAGAIPSAGESVTLT